MPAKGKQTQNEIRRRGIVNIGRRAGSAYGRQVNDKGMNSYSLRDHRQAPAWSI